MLPPWLNFAVMATGYLLVMGCLAAGLRLARKHPGRSRLPDAARGPNGLLRRVAGTAAGGYVVLMAVVVGYYQGVAGLGGGFLADAFTENLLLLCLTLPVFLVVSAVASAVASRAAARAAVREASRAASRTAARWRGRP